MNFQEQNNLLLQSYIDNYVKGRDSVEFILSSECDQRCEYCYLQKHALEMNYPRANKKQDILHNLQLLLDYFHDNNFQFSTYDIYSGEFFNLSYWDEVLDIIYNYQLNGMNKNGKLITIPTNFSFIADEQKTIKIEQYIEKFYDINIGIHLSCSIDGPNTVDNYTRPNINNHIEKNQQFYIDVIKFCVKHNFSFHPMIGKHFLQNYKENYDWFIDNIVKYQLYFIDRKGRKVLNPPMLLEIRDAEEWDEESLKNYHDFLWYVFEKDLTDLFDNNLQQMIYHMFDDHSELYGNTTDAIQTQPYILAYPYLSGNRISCSIQNNFVIRVGDLTMAPCHRLYYSEFEYGKFITDDNNSKIIGIEGYNPTLGFKIAAFNPSRSNLKCSNCVYKSFCLQGCLGSQYEHTTELFGCEEEVCQMYKIKYSTIHQICEEKGIYDIVLKDPYIPSARKEFVNYARRILSKA